MAISTQDVKLFKSERIDDTPQGGGRMTSTEIVDNELNNLFDDTSRLDRSRGRVSMRKAFGAVQTNNRDKFLGVHAIITDPPDDGQVSVTILELNDHDDERDDAKQYVESYLVAGAVTVMTLLDSQPEGARSIVAYVDELDTYTAPAPGDVIVLSVESVTQPNNGYQQFVRIDSVSSYVVQLSTRRKVVYTFDITSPLEITFPGGDLVEYPTIATRPTRIRETQLNRTVRYYGVVPLAEEAEPGDSVLKVSTILQPVVPASYSEVPVLDQALGPDRTAVIAAGPSYTETISGVSSSAGGGLTVGLPRGIQPGTLTLTLTAGSSGNNLTLVDNGSGGSTRTGGGANTVNSTAVVTYAGGNIVLASLPASVAYTVTAAYVPAAAIPDVAHTMGQLIDEPNTGFNYPFILIPKPAPGTVTATYRALGRWYTLTDNGSGQLIGAAGTGAGLVNYLTGTVNVTTGYQPDVGSSVLVGWRTPAHYLIRNTDTEILIGSIRLETDETIKPGSFSVSWEYAAVTYTVTDDGEGNLTGHCVAGAINYAEKFVQFVPTVYPAKLTELEVEYQALPGETYIPDPQPTPGPSTVTFTLPDAPHEPGSVRIRVAYEYLGTQRILEFVDDGNNVLLITVRGVDYAKGTVNYTTGDVVLDKEINL